MSASQPYTTVRVVDSRASVPRLPLVVGEGEAAVVMWPGNGALYRTFQVLTLKPGDRTVDLTHPSDSAYYVSAGAGDVVDLTTGERQALAEGAMLHIDRGDRYRFETEDTRGLVLIGGPCPADPALYAGIASAAAE